MRVLTPTRLALAGSLWPSVSIRTVIWRTSAAISLSDALPRSLYSYARSQERSKTSAR